MSLAVVIKGPEGVVLAADSRVTLKAQAGPGQSLAVNFDNATKLLSFSAPHTYVAAVTYGVAVIGRRTAHSFLPEFEVTLRSELTADGKKEERLKVEEFAQRLSGFYVARWNEAMPADYVGPGMVFIVGGYDPDDAYGKVFLVQVPHGPKPEPKNPGNEFGMTWGGQLHVASRIINGIDPEALNIIIQTLNLQPPQSDALEVALGRLRFPIPYDVLPLQDCINLAIFLIRATMTALDMGVGVRGVGGPIDVAVINRTGGFQPIQIKEPHGERQ